MRTVEALGVLDVESYTMAVAILDDLLKSANVELLHQELDLGGKLVTLFVGGSVSEVVAVVEGFKALKDSGSGLGRWLKNAVAITKPHPGILDYVLAD